MGFSCCQIESCDLRGGATALQAAVDPLDGVAFILGDDALLDVGVDLLVHEVLQLGKVIIWEDKHSKDGFTVSSKEEDHETVVSGRIDQTLNSRSCLFLRRQHPNSHNLAR